MTTHKEALTLALEALKDNQHLVADNERHAYVMEYNGIIEKCEKTLSQPEQEPAYWQWRRKQDDWQVRMIFSHEVRATTEDSEVRTLYTTPPQRTWVGLTDDEINEVLGGDIHDEPNGLLEFVRAIEAKLKEKNT